MCIKILILTVCICPHRDDLSLCSHAVNLRLSPFEIFEEPLTAQGWTTRLPTVLQGHVDWKFSEGQTQWEHCPAYKTRNRHPSDHGGNGSKIVAGKENSCPETQELAGRLEGQWTRVVRRLCDKCEDGHGLGTRGLSLQQQQRPQHREMSYVVPGKQPVAVLNGGGIRRAASGRRVSMIPTVGGRERLSVASKTIGVRSDESWIRGGLRSGIPVQQKANHTDGIRVSTNIGSSNGGRSGLTRSVVGNQKKSPVWQRREWR